MPCNTKTRAEIEQARQVRRIKALDAAIRAKAARIVKVGSKVSIDGWADRGDWCDECAMRWLKVNGSQEVRRQIAAVVGTGQVVYGHGH